MPRDSRFHPSNNEIIPAAPIWQDAADNEEWSAWADTTSGHSAALIDEEDEFGAWVDSSDPEESFHFQTPMSSPQLSTEYFEEPNIVTVRQLRRMNSSERYPVTFEAVASGTTSISSDPVAGLYSNPWNDVAPQSSSDPPRIEQDYNEDGDVDPELDSALASSAWESVLVGDRDSSRDSDTEEHDDKDGTYEAWNVEEQVDSEKATREDHTDHEFQAHLKRNDHTLRTPQLHDASSEAGLEWYNTNFNEVKETQRRPPTWMQRLNGNRRSREADMLGR